MRPARFAVLASSIALALVGIAVSQQPTTPAALPAKADLAKAEALVKDVLAADIEGAKTPGDRLKIADICLQQAAEAKKDPALRMVLTETAIQMLAKGGDVRRALTLTDELAKSFAIDVAEKKQKAYMAAAEAVSSKESAQSLVDLLLAGIQESLDAENFDSAAVLGKLLESAAAKVGDEKLLETAHRRASDIGEVRKSFDQIKLHLENLKKKPDDAAANYEAGRYYALFKAKWDKGLPMLARGSDQALREAAQRDLGNPEAPADRLAIADAWWALSQTNKDAAQLSLQRRAMHWYMQAVPELSGLNRTKAARRVDLVRARLAGEQGEGPTIPVGELKKYEVTDEVKSVSLSPDGRLAAAGCVDSAIRIWDTTADKEDKILRGHSKQVWGVVWHSNGRWLLSSSWDGTARIWDARLGSETKRFTHRVDLNGVAFSRDGNFVLAGSDDRTAILWNANNGDEVRKFPGHTGFVYSVAFSPDGKWAATGSGDKTARVWDTQNGQEVKVFDGHTSGVYGVAFTPDSKYLVTAGDGYAHVWDIANGKEVRRFEGHSGLVTTMALSPDGRRLLTGSDDKMVRVYDFTSGKLLHQYAGHRDTVTSVAFSADGRKALSGSLDRTMRLWGLPR